MKIPALGHHALAACVSFALLAACSSNGSQIAPSAVMQQSRGNVSGSWMKPDTSSEQLLYVSDPGTNDVQVYNYPKIGSPSLEGTLTGFDEPEGECVDATGNVWIANTKASALVEFAHGGSQPIATLSDPGESPASCAINHGTGDLAAVNLKSGNTAGSVSIYKNAQGVPTKYLTAEIVQPLFVTYNNNNSELFVDGLLANGTPGVALKRPKNNHFLEIGLSVSISSIGGIQWDGTYLGVGSRTTESNVIYRFGFGRRLNLKQTVPIKKACDMKQFFVTQTAVIVPDASCPSANTYKYPGGGLPKTKKVISQNLVAPFGSAISPKLTP